MAKRFLGVLAIAACGTSAPEAEAPALTPVPEIQATVTPNEAPPEPKDRHDVGPGGLAAPVAEALAKVFPQGRRIRCEGIPELAGEGALGAIWLGPSEEHLRAPTVEGGWFAGVAPVAEGKGIVLRDGKVVAELAWADASTAAWAPCTVKPAERYQILGLVQTPERKVVAGAKVRGCEDGVVAQTNASGRFELQGVSGRDCPLIAIVDDAAGLGRSEPTIVRSVRPPDIVDPITKEKEPQPLPDALVEITLTEERVGRDAVAEQTRRIHGLKERALRNGLAAEAEGFGKRIDAAQLSPEARAVADRWVADLAARLAKDEHVVDALAKADVDGLLTYWLHDL